RVRDRDGGMRPSVSSARGDTPMSPRLVCALAFVVLPACGSSGTDHSMLRLSLSAMQPLANGFHYEGWAIIMGQPLSTGKFNVDATGKLVTLAGASIASGEFDTSLDLSMASAIVVTIEPKGDTDALLSPPPSLAGTVAAGSAALSVGAAQALGSDFRAAAGQYILATPTNSVTTDEKSGVWFLDLSSGTPAAGLSLPALPLGWAYEGWAVIGGTPVSTGRFTSASGSDQAAPFSGPNPGPPFPGEDFVQAAPAGLSVAPAPDAAPAPFVLKPLVGMVPATGVDHKDYVLDNKAAGFPTGTATIP